MSEQPPAGPQEPEDRGPAEVPDEAGESAQSASDEREAAPEGPQPDGIPPKAGYPSIDPRHDDKPYEPGRHDGVPREGGEG